MNFLEFDRQEWIAHFEALGEPGYRGEQVFKWVHQRGTLDPEQMTNLSKKSRALLASEGTQLIPEAISDRLSKDGTRKWLLRLADGNAVETVFIPEDDRGTLCISSQVGCALNCSFCSTGAMGFSRNLSTAEIVGQVWFAVRTLSQFEMDSQHKPVTNVVFMGMGEPLLNYEAVLKAMRILMDDCAYGLSKYRVTLSTSGLVPMMKKLSAESACSLAVSLHAPTDELRNQLVPINRKYPLEELMAACREFFSSQPRRKVTFEYTLLKGVNDQPQQARQLIKLVEKVPCKMNLIPFNPFPGTQYVCSDKNTILNFQAILMQAGLNTTLRKTRGQDIEAACGQLMGEFEDKTSRSKEHRILVSELKRSVQKQEVVAA